MVNNNMQVVACENKLSKLLGNKAVKALAEDLRLTKKQIEKANATALSLQSNEKLAKCDQFSLLQYCYSVARYNFVRDDAVYPVPYGQKVQAQFGYQGYRELAMRTGKYKKIDCVEVMDCDTITTTDDGEPDVQFNPNYLERKKGKVIGYFGFAKDKEGNFVKRVFWTIEECEKHGKRYSKTYGSLWGNKEDFPKMAKKTVIKQVCKSLDYSPLMEDALKEDQIVYGAQGQANTYADNPKVSATYDFSATAQSTTANSILPPTEEVTEPAPAPKKDTAVKKEANYYDDPLEGIID